MDKTGIMDPRVIAGTFENGLMGPEGKIAHIHESLLF
jgi:hypothetical protein